MKICSPSWPPDTNTRPSNTVTPAALRLTLISVTTTHLRETAVRLRPQLRPLLPLTHLSVSGE